MKPIDVKSNFYIYFKESNKEDPKLEVCNCQLGVRISKYKKKFSKGYIPNWSEEGFVIKKFKNTFLWKHVISGDLNVEEIVRTFYENKLENKIKKVYILKSNQEKRLYKLYVK